MDTEGLKKLIEEFGLPLAEVIILSGVLFYASKGVFGYLTKQLINQHEEHRADMIDLIKKGNDSIDKITDTFTENMRDQSEILKKTYTLVEEMHTYTVKKKR